jgi:hypothetical protein
MIDWELYLAAMVLVCLLLLPFFCWLDLRSLEKEKAAEAGLVDGRGSEQLVEDRLVIDLANRDVIRCEVCGEAIGFRSRGSVPYFILCSDCVGRADVRHVLEDLPRARAVV